MNFSEKSGISDSVKNEFESIKNVNNTKIQRNILLNPGPSTTTDTVKYAQVVPDICPREQEFASLMKGLREDLVRIVHGDLEKYTSVLFCGSGTLNIDVCLNSLLPENKKVLIINNGAYSERAVEICQYYGLPYLELKYSVDERPLLSEIEKVLKENTDIALVYATHNETGTGILNPVCEIGKLVHENYALFVVDTTSTYAMRPIDIEKDNIDFLMASAQKGLMAFTGLSFIVGNRSAIEASRHYPRRSYYCNLFLQYDYFEKTGEMHFTPPVQTIYATLQALKEYWAEGEQAKWARHTRTFNAINKGLDELGFKQVIRPEWRAGLVSTAIYPDDPNWSFAKIHDYCYKRGFTIYPGKISNANTFRLCALGAIDEKDIFDFFEELKPASITSHNAAWKMRVSRFATRKFREVSLDEWQSILDEAEDQGKSQSTINNAALLIKALNSYAMERDIIGKNYAEYLDIPSVDPIHAKGALDDLQLARLEQMAAAGVPWADTALMLCYTGFRISEFLSLTRFSWHPEEGGYLQGGLKTEAGRNRVVPVHPKIRPYLDRWMAKGGDTIICSESGHPISPGVYRQYFSGLMEQLGAPGATPHWCRHTFATRLHAAKADPLSVKWLMGHSTKGDITARYTHETIAPLVEAVHLLA